MNKFKIGDRVNAYHSSNELACSGKIIAINKREAWIDTVDNRTIVCVLSQLKKLKKKCKIKGCKKDANKHNCHDYVRKHLSAWETYLNESIKNKWLEKIEELKIYLDNINNDK